MPRTPWLTSWPTSSSIRWVALLVLASATAHAEFPHRVAGARQSGEAALASFWATTEGRCSVEHCLELTQPPWESAWGDERQATRLAIVAKRLGIGAGWQSPPGNSAVEALIRTLAVHDAAILPLRDRWVLVWGSERKLRMMDPAGSVASIDASRLQGHWRVESDGARQFLPLKGRVQAPLPELTSHSHLQYVRKLEDVQRRSASLVRQASERELLQEPFHVLVERPFVVAGDASRKEVERWASGSVRWAVQRMKAKYFSKDPDQVLEIWLFNGKQSYERNVEALFGRKPSTPYGYYSPRNGALVMNIQTGGGTLVHEILHPFMGANFPSCPSWFNEGLASLYEQSTERDQQIWGLTNWRLAGLQRAIAADGVPTFEQLCGTTTREFYDDRTGVHYAQARYLCYYLQEHGLLDTYYREFRRRHDDDPGGYKTLVQVLEVEQMDAFEKDWKRYIMKLRYPEPE